MNSGNTKLSLIIGGVLMSLMMTFGYLSRLNITTF
jgi:hypothetical protein